MKHLIFTFAFICLIASSSFGQSTKSSPTVKETLHWMQTTLEDGAGDFWVGHEVRSIRLEDFDGCKVHFHYSVHQEPYLNGEPAPDKKPTHQDYFFALADIDPNATTFSKGPRIDTQSLVTIHTRNDEKKITIQLSYESREEAEPDSTFLIFSLNSADSEYVVRFTKAFKHAVEACGGKPSTF